MKKILIFMLFIISLAFSVCARAEVTEIKNTCNVGIYTIDEKVSFEITRDSDKTELCLFKIFDIDGNIIAERSFTSTNKTDSFSLGYFPIGWYRVKVFCDGVESNIFASFSVIQKNNAEISNKLSPFSIMHLGRLVPSKYDAYADALKRLGVGTVRTDEIADIYKSNRPYEKYAQSLNSAGIDLMSTAETNSSNMAGDNLLEVYDVYRTMVNAYGDKVSKWEIINEPDLKNTISADSYASWYKAASLAVSDYQPNAVKSFGGLGNPNSSYLDILMQNEIMKYSDTLNIHSHQQDSENGIMFEGSRVNLAKIYSAIYADNAPVWCTEAGLAMEVVDEEQQLPSEQSMRRQARYMITSFMQAIAKYGADKNFWFFAPHYSQEGPEYGTFSKNHMPYPAINSLNVLTHNLKDGIVLGEIKKSDDIEGYFFDCGDYDVAVVWKTKQGNSSVQLRTEENVSVINLVGNADIKKYSPITGKASIDISQDPVLIKLSGKSSSDDYVKTAFLRNLPEPQKITNPAERVVIQQIWAKKPEISNGHYRINDNTEYNVKCRIYNFNNVNVTGNYYVQNTDGIEVSGDLEGDFNIAANSYSEKNITVKVSQNAKDYSMQNLAFYAEISDGGDISPSVSQMRVFRNEYNADGLEITVIPEANYYSNAEQGDAWSSQIRPTVTNYSAWGGEYKVKYKSGNIKNSTMPAQVYIYQNNLNVNKDSEGMYFEFTCDKFPSRFESTYFHVSVSGKDGTFKFDNVFKFNGNTKNKKIYIPWNAFVNSKSNTGITDPAKITTFHFGWHISSEEEYSLDFTMKNVGTYKSENLVNTEKQIEISGVSDSGEYYTNMAKAKIETYDSSATEIFINYEKTDYNADENGVFDIDFSEFEPGKYSLIVACSDEFNKKVYKEVKFILLEERN